MKLTMVVGTQEFAFEGEAQFSELRELAEAWLTAIAVNDPQTQVKLDALVARLKAANDALDGSVHSITVR